MRTFALLYGFLVAVLIWSCTPKTGSDLSKSEPINGITESIEEPIVNPDPNFMVSGMSAQGPVNRGAFRTTAAEEAKIDSLLSVMTVAEKAGQMNQYTSFYDITGPAPEGGTAEERFNQVRDGLVGSMLNVTGAANTRKIQELAMQSRLKIPILFAFDVIHGFRTQFPVPLAEAATFDEDLIQQAARWAAVEASAYGIHWTFAPMVDVSPDARWGRIVEGAGEDPYWGSVVAAARVRGFQGNSLRDETSLAACAKHFAGYGYALGGRDYNASELSDYTLHNDVLPPFLAAAEAGSATFMNGFHTRGGVPVTGDRYLQREWLKGKHGWPGFIVSDWGSIGEMVAHGAVADKLAAAELAVTAGSDMDMETAAFVTELPKLVASGKVDEALVDDAVRRILRVKMALGLFDDPFKNCDAEREASVGQDPAMRAAAIETAARSAVLLKNDGSLLPLDPSKAQRIVVIGDLATDRQSPQGTWSLAAERDAAVTLMEALRMQTQDAVQLTHVAGPPTLRADSKQDFLWEVFPNTADRSGMDAAVAAARTADVVLMALGEPGFMSGEARSRTDIGLPGLQQELFDRVAEVNKNVAVILYTGRPLAIEEVSKQAKAILLAWQPGTFGQIGISELVFGKRSPAGKLPVSFPYTVGQEPLTYRHYSTGRPGSAGRPDGTQMVFNSHYMDAPRDALYPFGYGLSYTTFKLSDMTAADLSDATTTAPGKQNFRVSARVTNTGKVAGTEVVQLYINDPVASRVRPTRELKGVRAVSLAPGASQLVTFELGNNELQFWTPEQGWHVEPGEVNVWVATSSSELGEPATIRIGKQP